LLPTPAQQVDPLLLLAPAVVQSPQGVLVYRGEPARNVFQLDSLSVTNNYSRYAPNVAPFIMQESVSEMQVIPAAPTPAFTYTYGGWVNAVSKSGTNSLHASAYDYYAQNSWDKPDFFGNGFVPTGRYNNGGISLGTPIVNDTLFFYGNIQHLNNSSQELNRILNPLLTTPDGSAALDSLAVPAGAILHQSTVERESTGDREFHHRVRPHGFPRQRQEYLYALRRHPGRTRRQQFQQRHRLHQWRPARRQRQHHQLNTIRGLRLDPHDR
jgi:hypothetical protein